VLLPHVSHSRHGSEEPGPVSRLRERERERAVSFGGGMGERERERTVQGGCVSAGERRERVCGLRRDLCRGRKKNILSK
jgi:hypothetical protein